MSMMLALLLLLTLPTAAAAAGTKLTVKTPTVLPKAGETFIVEVDISGNPGIAAAQFTLTYDKASMTCSRAMLGSVLSGMLSATNPDATTGAIIAAASADEASGDGALGVFTFTAKKDLTAWDFSVIDALFNGADGKNISFTGGTEIESEPTRQPVDPTTPAEQKDPDTPVQPVEPTAPTQPTEIAAEESAAATFADMNGHWGAEFVRSAAEMGLFTGYPDGLFHPDEKISRADFVTVLWRSAGSPEPKAAPAFADVPANAYYAKAVAWAKENGYVDGTSSTTFDPAGVLQRQAAMKILYFYNGAQSGMELLLTGTYDKGFADSGEIASWAKEPMYWAYYNGIISGTGNNCLSPQMTATRAQMAKILVNYLEKNH